MSSKSNLYKADHHTTEINCMVFTARQHSLLCRVLY